MRKLNFVFMLILLSGTARAGAETLNTRIHDLIEEDSRVQVFSTVDGRVYSASKHDPDLYERLKTAKEAGFAVTLELNGDQITALHELPPSEQLQYSDDLSPAGVFASYEPTRLQNVDEARELFNQLQTRFRFLSQCYQRAELWTHDLWQSRQIKSMKVFMFFGKKFIRQANYHWWYHVAPYVLVGDTEYVMDREFLDEPKTMRAWTDAFMNRKGVQAGCRVVSSYREYKALSQAETDYCYLRQVPMYYYTPRDIAEAEERRTGVLEFRKGDLAHANRVRKRWL